MNESEKDIRDRIEALRLALRGGPGANGRGPGSVSRAADSASRRDGEEGPVSVDRLEGARPVETALGTCLAIERGVGDIVRTQDLRPAVGALTGDNGRPPYVFLDLETTGFSSTPLFLAGTMFERDGRLMCTQFLARDYSEEPALVAALDGLLGRHGVCITFNGKSFDLPYLRERAKYHRIDLGCDPGQLDLLHLARRMWRESLPNCRLTTLERHILGRVRSGDVPGWEVPCIYHEFVHTGDARRLVGVIRHNLLDVVSMAELLICLAEG